jgi:hypothetical protein
MLLTASRPTSQGTSYKLTGVVRASNIFFWAGEPLRLDLSRATKILGEAADEILRAANSVVVEIIAQEGSTGESALQLTAVWPYLRKSAAGVYEVII